MNALKALWRQLRAELSANHRLRLGVWGIAFTLLLFLTLLQGDRLVAAYEGYAGAADRLARAERLLEGHDWTAAKDLEQQRNAQLAAAFWRAETQGVAEASLQAALTQLLASLEFYNVRIRPGVSQPVPDVPGLWQIQAQVNAGYRKGAELQLLYALANSEKKIIVDRMDMVSQDAGLLLIVSAYFTGIAEDPQA